MKDGELGRVYNDGEVICKEGDTGDVMYAIQSGKVKISKLSGGKEQTLIILGGGDLFGEMALFDRKPRSATATALGEARVLSIDKKKLFTSISHDPTLVFKLLETMSQRIRRLSDDVVRLLEAKANMLEVISGLGDVCTVILSEARKIIKADNGSVMLCDEKSNTLSIVAAFGAESDQKLPLTTGEGIAGSVIQTGRAELVNNVALDSRFMPGEMKIRSMMCVPFKCSDNRAGVINMSVNSDRLFTVDDLKALNALTPYASMAVMNAKIFSDLRHTAENLLIHAALLNV